MLKSLIAVNHNLTTADPRGNHGVTVTVPNFFDAGDRVFHTPPTHTPQKPGISWEKRGFSFKELCW